jgi:hypothetical protein
MNLWVNPLRQLALLSVALFFFACEDETSLNGFRNPNPKFQGKYTEIPLTTSNLLLGNVRTSNSYFADEYGRFLVGQYEDPVFGKIKSQAVTQFYTNSGTKLPAGATIDSISIHLAFDLYLFGSKTTSDQKISIYQTSYPLTSLNRRKLYYDTDVKWSEDSLVTEKVFSVNPGLFKDFMDLNSNASEADDTTVVIKFPVDMNGMFATKLRAKYESYSATPSDSSFIDFSKFSVDFPGLAFVSSEATTGQQKNNMIMGFNPGSASRVVIHYSTDVNSVKKAFSQSLVFSNLGLLSYNKIETERVGDLSGITQFQDQPTEDGNRYVQSGTGLVTKLNLDNFFDFANQVSEKDIVLNSAQLVINDVVVSDLDPAAPPRGLALRLLEDNNHIRKYAINNEVLDRDSILFLGLIAPDYQVISGGRIVQNVFLDNDSTFYGVADAGSGVALRYSDDDKNYSGFLTLLFQRLYKQRNNADRMRNFALYPTDPSITNLGAKSVNRAVFPSDKVVLKLYYTEPTVKPGN